MLFPLPPVMVTCGTMEKPNVLTIAWTGIVNSEPPMTYISVRPSRHSHKIIKESGEFVINISTLELAKACDYCGVKSGKNTDKFADMNLEIEPCKEVKAPMLVKAPVSLECKVQSVTSLGTHDMFMAEIVNVNVDDKYLEEDNYLALEKAGLLAFVHGRYYTLGRDLGAFGFSVDKTKENKTKPRKSKFLEVLKIEKQIKEGTEKIKEKRTSAPRTNRKDGERRLYPKREGEEKKAFGRRGEERRPYAKRSNEERKPYGKRDGEERKPYGKHSNEERKPYGRDNAPKKEFHRSPFGKKRFNKEGQ